MVTGAAFNPSVISTATGTARVSWQANWDKDNQNLSYQLIRDGKTATPIYTKTQESDFWRRPGMGYIDTGLAAGSTHTYQIIATDAFGNTAKSNAVSVTTATAGSVSDYARGVLDDGAADYWRLGEGSGGTAVDWAGWSDISLGTGATRGTAGAITGDTNAATTFDGTNTGFGATQTRIQGPDTFTAEAWFKTTSTSGGKILGFGNSPTGESGSYDRHVYMDNAGRIIYGVYTGNTETLQSSAGFNDGQWHQVTVSLGSNGMVLYVDGKRIAKRADVTSGQPYTGVWRIGGDNLNGWPSQPASSYFQGSIDEVSHLPDRAGRCTRCQNALPGHRGRTLNLPTAPADNYGKAVFQLNPDLYWRLGENYGNDGSRQRCRLGNTGTFVSGTSVSGRPGALAGVTNTAVELRRLDRRWLSSDAQCSNPTAYSEELWFNTTTKQGGKLIGFGGAHSGGNGKYDRHVYMETDGRLTFGVWTGQRQHDHDQRPSTTSLAPPGGHAVVPGWCSTSMAGGRYEPADPRPRLHRVLAGWWRHHLGTAATTSPAPSTRWLSTPPR